MSQSFRLYRLQQLDSQLDRVRARLQAIALELQDDQALQEAKSLTTAAEINQQNALKALRKAEDTVKDQRLKIETTEAALYGGKVRNPKELQDLQNESAALKRFLSVLEDRQLEAMLAEEEATASLEKAVRALGEAELDHTARQNELKQEERRLHNETPDLEAERLAATSSISPDELVLYESLRKSRRGLAVTMVKYKACSSCGTTLSATLLDAALTTTAINRCEGCGRIIYIG